MVEAEVEAVDNQVEVEVIPQEGDYSVTFVKNLVIFWLSVTNSKKSVKTEASWLSDPTEVEVVEEVDKTLQPENKLVQQQNMTIL